MGKHKIEEGIRLTLEKRVEHADLALSSGTSGVKALATSALIQLMEKAISSLVDPYLQNGTCTVSSEINVRHIKPVGEGALIRCMVHLKFREENKLYFDVVVLDDDHEEVAIGAHRRHIVSLDSFNKLIDK